MLKNNIFLFKGDEFMKKHIISIGRQYGCGAHEIATKLSEKLGIPYPINFHFIAFSCY